MPKIPATIGVTEIDWIAEHRFRFRFSDDSVAACDLAPLLAAAAPDEPPRDIAYCRMVVLVDGVPTWPNGFKLAPDRLRQHIDAAMRLTLQLDDSSDAILIGKSGEPVPAPELLAWLGANCRRAWHYRYDGAWNVYFSFEDDGEAERFKRRWNAREAVSWLGGASRR